MTKAAQFRGLLRSGELEFLLEAHNGLSAKIGEEAGFKGLWASGLCLSAQFGVRDSNEASWTQVLDMLEFMSDATEIPIMLDGDTGYGNFNSMRRLVRKLEQRDVAAVCIEDKLFPKTNSFIDGESQPLADVTEFCGKIKAGKDGQKDPDFTIVARVEALIAGWGLGEALARAHAYADAGADAILIHSAKTVPDEVLAFMREWQRDCPVVIVPTRYYSAPTDLYRDAGVSVVIWANHLLRSAVAAMQDTAATIAAEQNLLAIEERVVPVREIFRLQGAHELAEAERRYLPVRNADTRVIVLAASQGDALGQLTADRPKALIDVSGQPLAQHIVDAYNSIGVKDITIVRGYLKEAFDLTNVRYVDNDRYESTGELVSLQAAFDELPDAAPDSTVIVSYGDVLFGKFVPQVLLESDEELAIMVDTDWHSRADDDQAADLVECSSPYERGSFYERIALRKVSADERPADVHGEWMGFLKIGPAMQPIVRAAIEELIAENERLHLPDLLNALVAAGHHVAVIYSTGHWLDVDSVADVAKAGGFWARSSPA
jgi:phosphoenolpyruvate phosphomutase